MPQIPFDPVTRALPQGGVQAREQTNVTGQTFGAGLQKNVDETIAVGAQFKQLQTETDVNSAYATDFSPAHRDLYQKFYSLQGRDALDQLQSTATAMNDNRERVRETLNPMGQKMFDEIARRRIEMELDHMSMYADQQNKVYRQETHDATLSQHVSDAVDHYNDRNFATTMLNSGKAEIEAFSDEKGWSPQQRAEHMQQFTSQLQSARVLRQLNEDPTGAAKLFGTVRGDMDGLTQLKLEAELKNGARPVEARNVAEATMTGHPGTAPNLLEAMSKVESNNDPTAVGPVRQGEQAQGTMQVRPSTAANPGFGVTPAKDNTPAELQRVGQDYAQAMLTRYGDQTTALAAYNWGPDKVDRLLASSGGDPAKFMAGLPKETQDYIAKINKLAPPTAGTPPTAQDAREHEGAWVAQARATYLAAHPNDPAGADMAAGHVSQRVAEILHGQELQQQETRGQILMSVMGLTRMPDGSYQSTPNAQRPTTLDQLAQDPKMAEVLRHADPYFVTQINAKLEQNAAGKQPHATLESTQEYARLIGEAAVSPDAFAKEQLSDAKHFNLMPEPQLVSLINLQAQINDPNSKRTRDGDSLNRALNDDGVKALLASSGLPTTITDKSSQSQKDTYSQFAGHLQQSLTAFVDDKKRPPSATELQQMVLPLLAQGGVRGTGWWSRGTGWWSENSQRVFQSDADHPFVANRVPPGDRAKIIADFKKRFGQEPTEAAIAYGWENFQRTRQAKTQQ